MREEWRPVLRGVYEISSLGRFRRAKPGRRTYAGKILKPMMTKIGYFYVGPTIGGKNVPFYVHALVARAFLGPRRGREVNHLDGVKSNNRFTNLEYATHKRNMRHARSLGLTPVGSRCNRGHLTEADVSRMREEWDRGVRNRDLVRRFRVSPACVSQIVHRKQWRHVA